MEFLNEALEPRTYSSMENIHDLFTKLTINAVKIDVISNNIAKAEEEKDYESLPVLYRNEFALHMDNIGIYEDLIKSIEREPKNVDTVFELRRMASLAKEKLRVEVIEL